MENEDRQRNAHYSANGGHWLQLLASFFLSVFCGVVQRFNRDDAGHFLFFHSQRLGKDVIMVMFNDEFSLTPFPRKI